MIKDLPASEGDARYSGSIHGSGRSLQVGNDNPTPVFLSGKFHGQRSPASYSPWGHKESVMT